MGTETRGERPDRSYLHIGLPKTGTTYVQQLLWHNRDALATQRVHLPLAAESTAAHRYAAADLCDPARFHGNPAAERLTWQRLVEDAHAAAGTTLVSDELLASATHEQVARAVNDLAPTEIHVIVTVRDLARHLPSVWQQAVRFRDKRTFDEYLLWLSADDAPVWNRHDAPTVLRRWREHLPADRLHVIAVPPPGSSHTALWERFAQVVGIGADGLDLDVPRDNASLGAAQIELLRRFNAGLGDRVPAPRAYRRSVSFGLLHDLREPDLQLGRITLPPQWTSWVAERAERMIAELQALECDFIGSWDDLRPSAPIPEDDETTDADLARIAIEALRANVSRSDELRQQVQRLRKRLASSGGTSS
ncbi:sulfotransferase domain-containing protein [Nocardioidaceae bacterium SCSIO 66511]|nr:sulfotransferase domain-containing protein [Nocardioidaceae bacterium SCSIO 66511]